MMKRHSFHIIAHTSIRNVITVSTIFEFKNYIIIRDKINIAQLLSTLGQRRLTLDQVFFGQNLLGQRTYIQI